MNSTTTASVAPINFLANGLMNCAIVHPMELFKDPSLNDVSEEHYGDHIDNNCTITLVSTVE